MSVLFIKAPAIEYAARHIARARRRRRAGRAHRYEAQARYLRQMWSLVVEGVLTSTGAQAYRGVLTTNVVLLGIVAPLPVT